MSFDFFDRVYCIHLPNPRRRELIQAQLDKAGIKDAQFVHAAAPPRQFEMSNMRRCSSGEFGVNLSQIKAVIHALADGAQRPLFLEDDVTFDGRAGIILATALSALPDDWDVLYMGGHPRDKCVEPVGEKLMRVHRFSFAEAYAINGKALRGFVNLWLDRIAKPDAMYDFILSEYAASHNAYCVYPLLCEQLPNISQITGTFDDKRVLVARGWASNLAAEHVTATHMSIYRGHRPG